MVNNTIGIFYVPGCNAAIELPLRRTLQLLNLYWARMRICFKRIIPMKTEKYWACYTHPQVIILFFIVKAFFFIP